LDAATRVYATPSNGWGSLPNGGKYGLALVLDPKTVSETGGPLVAAMRTGAKGTA